MNDAEIVHVSYADIRTIEARARELRAQHTASLMRALGRKIAAVPHKIAGLFHKPHHA